MSTQSRADRATIRHDADRPAGSLCALCSKSRQTKRFARWATSSKRSRLLDAFLCRTCYLEEIGKGHHLEDYATWRQANPRPQPTQ